MGVVLEPHPLQGRERWGVPGGRDQSCPSLLSGRECQGPPLLRSRGPCVVNGAGSAWLCLSCREWVEDTQLWIQQVSSTPSTRMDVVHLQEQLDLKLQQRQARETGICPVRRELYSQCFGEWSEREAAQPSAASFPSLQ